MTEVVLDVKLASLGVLNISPRGLTDFFGRLISPLNGLELQLLPSGK